MDATAFQLQHLPCRIQIPKSPDGQDRNRMNIAWLVAGICFALGAVTMDLSMILIHRPGKSGSRDVGKFICYHLLQLLTFRLFRKCFQNFSDFICLHRNQCHGHPKASGDEAIEIFTRAGPDHDSGAGNGWQGTFRLRHIWHEIVFFLKFHQFFLIESSLLKRTQLHFFSFPSLLLWRNARATICKLRSLPGSGTVISTMPRMPQVSRCHSRLRWCLLGKPW